MDIKFLLFCDTERDQLHRKAALSYASGKQGGTGHLQG